MLVLITYDVNVSALAGRRRLRHIANACLDYGMRVQFSVFECDITPAQWAVLRARLLEILDPQLDSLRFYHLGKQWRRRVEHHGAKCSVDVFADSIII